MPAEIQARIIAIEARFAPSSSVGTSSTANAANTTAFNSLLLDQLQGQSGALGLTDSTNGGFGVLGSTDGSLSSLLGGAAGGSSSVLGSAMASRNATLGLNGLGGVGAVGTVGGTGSVGAGQLASKAQVAALERTLTNGRLDTTQLETIGAGSHKLQPVAATGFKQLRAAAADDGVTIGVTDSYRSYDAQVDVARRKGLYSEGGLAAKPGTSDHGLGLAVDLKLDAKALEWMRANAGRFGFVEDTPRESWHWKFDGI